jgi:hypothetical protein
LFELDFEGSDFRLRYGYGISGHCEMPTFQA